MRDRLAGPENLVDLVVGDAPKIEALARHALQFLVAGTVGVKQVLHGDVEVGAIEQRQCIALGDGLIGDVDVELVDAAAAADVVGNSRQFALVKLHKAGRDDILGQLTILDRPGFDAGQGDAVRRQLDAIDDAWRQRLAAVVSFLSLGQWHAADGALVGMIADDGGMHWTPVFRIGVGCRRRERGPRPFFVIALYGIPIEEDAADGGQQHEEAQAGLNRLQHLQDFPSQAVLFRRRRKRGGAVAGVVGGGAQ